MEQPAGPSPSSASLPPAPPPPPKISATAIWSLVTSLLCVPIVPIVLGGVALNRVSRSRGRLGGGGIALAGLIIGCLHVIGIPLLAGLATPAILRAKKRADMSMTLNQAREISLAMMAFENEFGTFPSADICTDNRGRFADSQELESSNDLLGLLIAGGFINDTRPFWVHGVSDSKFKPPNNPPLSSGEMNAPAELLPPGSCGWGYVMLQGGEAMSTSDNGGRPLLVTPLEEGGGGPDPRFDDRPFTGKAVCLRIDGSVKRGAIDDDGRAMLSPRQGLFETGPGTVWESDIPDVRGPE